MHGAQRFMVAIALVVAAGACTPLGAPGTTASIEFVSTSTVNGWKYDYFRNNAYPCSVSGYQTFVLGTKIGASVTANAPLWVHMHGGGVGYFDSAGNPVPGTNQKVEETAGALTKRLTGAGLIGHVRDDPAGFRVMAVSYCSHDIYAGTNTPDPNNSNTTPDGRPRPVTGLYSVKAAVQYVQARYPTTKTFLHGGSAGSVGTFGVAWGMQLQGIAPAGLVADAGILNLEARQAGYAQGVCADDNSPERGAAVAARVNPTLANIDNEPDKLVSTGRLTVPIMHIWNHGDINTCGSTPVDCPLRDGSHLTMGITDCMHQPMQAAIAAEGAGSRSKNFPVCVDNDATPDCSVHVVTTKGGLTNTEGSTPADYLGAIMEWVHARLADT
jgi:hypothetical protein